MKLSMETRELGLRFGIFEGVRMLQEAGFDGADLTLDKINPADDMLHRPDRAEFAQKLRDYSDSLGMVFTQAHAPFVMKYGDPFDLSHPAYADIVAALEIGGILGTPHVIVHAVKTPREDTSVDYKEYNRRFYLSLIPYCQKYGVKIAVENLFWHDKLRECYFGLFPTPAEMTEFVTSLNAEADCFVVCCDLGHAAITGTEPQDYIRGMDKSLLRSLHVQDTDYRGDRHFLPYQGKQNWSEVCAALREIGYEGDLSFEILHYIDKFPSETTPAALKFACTLGRYMISRIVD